MRRTLGKATAIVALIGTIGVSATGAAYGATTSSPPSSTSGTSSISTLKAKAASAISKRLTDLGKAVSAVNANSVISATDKSTLLATLNGDTSGLTALGTKIQGDSTRSDVVADYKTIFTGYRVYLLALPQVRFAAACDDITDKIVPRLTDAQNKLQSLLSGADSGKNTPSVQAAMADLATQIGNITSSISGLSGTVLAITPAQYDANHGVLSAPKSSLLAARSDVKTARSDVETVVAALK
ncbi:MAG: hypothetical protein ACYDD4_04090 [Acidimicrobiales bacterium]